MQASNGPPITASPSRLEKSRAKAQRHCSRRHQWQNSTRYQALQKAPLLVRIQATTAGERGHQGRSPAGIACPAAGDEGPLGDEGQMEMSSPRSCCRSSSGARAPAAPALLPRRARQERPSWAKVAEAREQPQPAERPPSSQIPKKPPRE